MMLFFGDVVVNCEDGGLLMTGSSCFLFCFFGDVVFW